MKEVSFTLDDSALRHLHRAAARLDIPKCQVVREALELYAEHLSRPPEDLGEPMLGTFDRSLLPSSSRVGQDLDAELEQVRGAWPAGMPQRPSRVGARPD
ncbi:MAG: hypothetical protein WD995_01525 [Gemmatimonadota bacterium]